MPANKKLLMLPGDGIGKDGPMRLPWGFSICS